jgi:hypothetical protein
MEFGQAYCKDFLKRNSNKFICIFSSFTLFLMIFLKFYTFFGNLSIHFWNFGKGKCFLARGPASGPQVTASRARGPLSMSGRVGHGLGAWSTSRPGQLWLWRVAST